MVRTRIKSNAANKFFIYNYRIHLLNSSKFNQIKALINILTMNFLNRFQSFNRQLKCCKGLNNKIRKFFCYKNKVTSNTANFFYENGYAVLPEYFTEDQIEELRQEALCLVSNANLEQINSVFQTSADTQKKSDEYFLKSGDKIRFFLEKEAIGKVGLSKEQYINKIGHGIIPY